jgi:hypothetical protein
MCQMGYSESQKGSDMLIVLDAALVTATAGLISSLAALVWAFRRPD